MPWHRCGPQVGTDRWAWSPVQTKRGRQAISACASEPREGRGFFKKHLTLCPPDASMAYTSPSIHTPLSLQNEHIVLCRGGQFAEFHFTSSICLMNNNEFEGFTGFQQWAENCFNKFSDLTWFLVLPGLPASCLSLHGLLLCHQTKPAPQFSLKNQEQNIQTYSSKRLRVLKDTAWTDFTLLVVDMTHFWIG